MKWRHLLVLFPLILLFIIPAYADSQTHTIDTSVYHWKLTNDARVKFDADTIYLGDSTGLWTWVDTDTIKFYNLRMGGGSCPSPWTLTLSSINVTVTSLFEDRLLAFELGGTEGEVFSLEFNVGSQFGKPDKILQSGTLIEGWTVDAGTLSVSDVLRKSPTSLEVWWGTSVEEPTHGGTSPPSTQQPEPEVPTKPPISPPIPETGRVAVEHPALLLGIAIVVVAIVAYAVRGKTAPEHWSKRRKPRRDEKWSEDEAWH